MQPLQEDVDFLLALPRFAAEANAQENSFDLNILEYYRDRTNDYAGVLNIISHRAYEIVNECVTEDDKLVATDMAQLIYVLLVHFLAIRERFEIRIEQLTVRQWHNVDNDNVVGTENRNTTLAATARVGVIHSGDIGRPLKNIEIRHIEPLRELGFSWRSIARILGVSERTLRNRRRDPSFEPIMMNYTDITDDELDQQMREIMNITNRSGETFMIGALRARGVRVQRRRLRECLGRIDPVGRALRRRRVIYRRHYNVPSPNYIWHIDGNHKLIDPWGFVIHGGIDGFSRLCVYLRCSTSNRARIVLEDFHEAVEKYGCPLRIRCDYGTENVEVARYMLRQRGTNTGSVLTGMSTHNQRIERLWRDVRECVTSIFSDIFFYMENVGIADRYDHTHVAAMRYVFGPRINRTLTEFQSQWNNHPIRTANNRSPNMLWIEGMLNTNVVHMHFGALIDFDEDAPVPDLQTNNNVQVPDVEIILSDNDINELRTQTDPLSDDENQGINIFLQTVDFLVTRQT